MIWSTGCTSFPRTVLVLQHYHPTCHSLSNFSYFLFPIKFRYRCVPGALIILECFKNYVPMVFLKLDSQFSCKKSSIYFFFLLKFVFFFFLQTMNIDYNTNDKKLAFYDVKIFIIFIQKQRFIVQKKKKLYSGKLTDERTVTHVTRRIDKRD